MNFYNFRTSHFNVCLLKGSQLICWYHEALLMDVLVWNSRLIMVVVFSCSVMSDSLWQHGLWHSRLPCPSPSPTACPNSCPLNWWYHPIILFSGHPLLLLPSVSPSIRVFSSELALRIRWLSFSFSISSSNEYLRLISFMIDWFDHLAVQETQEPSPTPQLKSINSLAFSLFYGPTLTSVHDYWKTLSVALTARFWRRKWQPTPVLLPRRSHGQRSLVSMGSQSQTYQI